MVKEGRGVLGLRGRVLQGRGDNKEGDHGYG